MFASIQNSLFVDYHIDVNPEIVNELLGRLNNLGGYTFLPTIVNGQKLDLVSSRIETVSNISFVVPQTSACSVVCMDERIDCNIQVEVGRERTLREYLDFCRNAIGIIADEFSIASNRMAVNIDYFGREQDSINQFTPLVNVATLPCFYRQGDLSEFNLRVNKRDAIRIQNRDEVTNVITDYRFGKNNETDRVLEIYHFDINTAQEDTSFRFHKADNDTFVEYATTKISEIVDSIEQGND